MGARLLAATVTLLAAVACTGIAVLVAVEANRLLPPEAIRSDPSGRARTAAPSSRSGSAPGERG